LQGLAINLLQKRKNSMDCLS